MKLRASRHRVLDPLERFSEIVFGLIMVLTFTCAIGVWEAERNDVRIMIIGALGCNLAWAIIDAVFYLIACLAERGHEAVLLNNIRQSADPARVRQAISAAMPAPIAAAFRPDDLDRAGAQLLQTPAPAGRPRFTARDWRGALGVFLLVFLSTLPVVVPFVFVQPLPLALRISNGVAIVMLFGAGYMLAAYAGMRRIPTGLSMVAIGVFLVALAMMLGG